MKKFVVLIFAIAGLAFLSEPTARAGVHFAFGFPVPFPVFYGPDITTPIPTTIIIRGMPTTAGITDRTGATGITITITAAAIMVTATMVEDITGMAIGTIDSRYAAALTR